MRSGSALSFTRPLLIDSGNGWHLTPGTALDPAPATCIHNGKHALDLQVCHAQYISLIALWSVANQKRLC
jgi:hypothetical protein